MSQKSSPGKAPIGTIDIPLNRSCQASWHRSCEVSFHTFLFTVLYTYVGESPLTFFKNFFSGGYNALPGNNAQWGNPFSGILGHWGHFYWLKTAKKFNFFHVLRHFRALPRTPFLVKIQFFWLKIMSFQYGFTTTFNLEDWSTVEGARAI